jgi:hypothetical protein
VTLLWHYRRDPWIWALLAWTFVWRLLWWLLWRR